MDYAVELDVPFLADSLLGLTKRNVRHFRDDIELAHTVLRRMLNREYKWIDEYPDTWRDAIQMADPDRFEFDCEDFAAAFAALMVICFGEARVGIRRVDKHQCHALAGLGSSVYDICPLFGMPGSSQGAIESEWRDIKDKPMIAEGISLITSGVRRLMADSEEKPPVAARKLDTGASLPDDWEHQLDTGASLANILTSLLPPAMIDKVERLERDFAAMKKDRDAIKKERDALRKERDALKKGLADMTTSRNEQSAKRITAETTTAKTKEQLAAESRRLAEARAFHTACKEQLQQVLSRSSDQGARTLAREGLDRLSRERPEDYLDAFADEEQRLLAWELLGTGAAHLASLPEADCESCARGEPCTRTGAADEANGDEPPDNTSGPDSNEYDVGAWDGPPSSERNLSMSGCDGSCPR